MLEATVVFVHDTMPAPCDTYAASLSDKGITNLGIAISPWALRLDGPSP